MTYLLSGLVALRSLIARVRSPFQEAGMRRIRDYFQEAPETGRPETAAIIQGREVAVTFGGCGRPGQLPLNGASGGRG
jgi:hypothetical protein